MNVAATNPPRSHTTPPPSAMTAESRPNPASSIWSVTAAHVWRVLCASPAGIVNTSVANPVIAARARSAYRGPTLLVSDDRVPVRAHDHARHAADGVDGAGQDMHPVAALGHASASPAGTSRATT